jgi:hypothetical protein
MADDLPLLSPRVIELRACLIDIPLIVVCIITIFNAAKTVTISADRNLAQKLVSFINNQQLLV